MQSPHGDCDPGVNLISLISKNFYLHTLQLPIEDRLPALDSVPEWLNSRPLAVAGLHGKVVLVQFWAYTCINWLRTLPYARAWAMKYRDRGLVVIGVHTPEFVFERDIDNVRRAAKDLRVDYPISIDNDYAIWHAFKNQYWPALYFVDAKGQIRHHQFGEGEYEQSERIIQQLLAEAGFDRLYWTSPWTVPKVQSLRASKLRWQTTPAGGRRAAGDRLAGDWRPGFCVASCG